MRDSIANDFMRAILADREDATVRLVFADWLEETGDDSNVAWANFIRSKIELERLPQSDWRTKELARSIELNADLIRARLTLRAGFFVENLAAVQCLIPLANLRLNLEGFDIPRSVVDVLPPSVAYLSRVVLIDARKAFLLLVSERLLQHNSVEKLMFILNRDISVVQAATGQFGQAIERYYGPLGTTEYHDTPLELIV